jgi:hypothetical protein
MSEHQHSTSNIERPILVPIVTGMALDPWSSIWDIFGTKAVP